MGDPVTWARIRAWRDRLAAVDVGEDPGVLSAAGAREAWRAALDALDDEALATAAAVPGRPFRRAAVIAARTVRTAVIEWCAVLLGHGTEVLLKHPAGDPGWAPHLAAAATAAGLPLRVTASRDVGDVDLIVVMGSDDTARAVRDAAPVRTRVLAFGHRFSAAWLTGRPLAHDPLVPDGYHDAAGGIAADAALHDGRGCFSPVAVFTDTPEALVDALADALARAAIRWPRGRITPIEGATIRARQALARVEGRVVTGDGWAIHVLPAARFEPTALPRTIAVHPVPHVRAALDAVRPWSPWLSCIATDAPDTTDAWLDLGATRVCRPGRLQRPPLARAHDGVDWLRAVVRATTP